MLSTITPEQIHECLSTYGLPLENYFLVGGDEEELQEIVFWHPEVGLRGLIIEKDDLARAVHRYLRTAGARRFQSWDEVLEARDREQWPGWNTCADYRRFLTTAEEIEERDRRRSEAVPQK